MKPNPGGTIAPEDVVGRDKNIADFWRVLEGRSLVISSERRVGKTSVIKKMEAEPAEDVLPIYHDLEGLQTPLQFVETVFRDVEGYLGRWKRQAARARQLMGHLAGVELHGLTLPDSLTPHWKNLLVRLIEDLAEHQEHTLVFFWDEFPLMLYDIMKTSGADQAGELLDILRSLRQMNPKIRVVFAGSIGLHNVLATLKGGGYANEPINDMAKEVLPPLARDDADDLARRLIDGASIQTHDPEALARTIAKAVDGVPYYIHHVANEMAKAGGEQDKVTVDEIILRGLTSSENEWDMRHYDTRIDTYYSDNERPIARAILDGLAVRSEPASFADVFGIVKAKIETNDEEQVRRVVRRLLGDHYIMQENHGAYAFRFPLVQRWWKLDRGLWA